MLKINDIVKVIKAFHWYDGYYEAGKIFVITQQHLKHGFEQFVEKEVTSWISGGNEYFIIYKENESEVRMIHEVSIHKSFTGTYEECIKFMYQLLAYNFEEDYENVAEFIEDDGIEINTPQELHKYLDGNPWELK